MRRLLRWPFLTAFVITIVAANWAWLYLDRKAIDLHAVGMLPLCLLIDAGRIVLRHLISKATPRKN